MLWSSFFPIEHLFYFLFYFAQLKNRFFNERSIDFWDFVFFVNQSFGQFFCYLRNFVVQSATKVQIKPLHVLTSVEKSGMLVTSFWENSDWCALKKPEFWLKKLQKIRRLFDGTCSKKQLLVLIFWHNA